MFSITILWMKLSNEGASRMLLLLFQCARALNDVIELRATRTSRITLWRHKGSMYWVVAIMLSDSFAHLQQFVHFCKKFPLIRLTKTKVITLANYNGRKQHKEPIRTRRKYMLPAPSAGKRALPSHDWHLIGKNVARVYRTNQRAQLCKTKANADYFRHSIENYSKEIQIKTNC